MLVLLHKTTLVIFFPTTFFLLSRLNCNTSCFVPRSHCFLFYGPKSKYSALEIDFCSIRKIV